MDSAVDIPRTPLNIRSNSSGSLSPVGLHRRGQCFHQESSYGLFWFVGAMLVIAAVIGVLPWHTLAIGGSKLKYWVAGGFAWGGVCVAFAYFIRNIFGQTIVIEPKRTLLIKTRRGEQTIPWADILGIQVCHQEDPKDVEMNGYQLNLVWKGSTGIAMRHCLMKHMNRRFVDKLGGRYESLFQFKRL